nr:MAG TPA: hypothetical protein [Bacteriophage sp.]
MFLFFPYCLSFSIQAEKRLPFPASLKDKQLSLRRAKKVLGKAAV